MRDINTKARTADNTITLDDGRVFPLYKGEVLSWPIGSTFTWKDEQEGYPRTRLVLSLTDDTTLERERYEELKASFNKMFGHQAKKLLALIEMEIERRRIEV